MTDINVLAVQYDEEEAFEAGRQVLFSLLPAEAGEAITFELLREVEPKIVEDQQRLAAFWAAYFTARLKIEQSYDFLQAFELYEWGAEQLAKIQQKAMLPHPCVQLRTRLNVHLVNIDRGLHNNDFPQVVETCDQLLALLESNAECKADLQTERDYVLVMRQVAQLLADRDAQGVLPETRWHEVKEALWQAYQKMQSKGLAIYSSILQSLWMALPVWQEAQGSRLWVTRGRFVTTYYATLNSMNAEGLVAALTDKQRIQELIDILGASAFYEPEPPDILSELSFKNQFHIWAMDLPEVVLADFREQGLTLQASVRLNSLGLMQLHFSTDLEGWDVNALRHLMNLPLENALDEAVQWQEMSCRYLREVAQTVLQRIDDWLDHNHAVYSLIFDVSSDINSTLLIEEAQTRQAGEVEAPLLTPEQFYAHADWRGLMIPPREVRSVYENWRMQTPHPGVENIATDLYHAQDWVQADGTYALIVQLDQPTWVTEQALENVQVVTGLRYFMKQLGEMLFENIRQIQLAYHDDEAVQEKSANELKQQEAEYRAKIQKLHRLGLDVKSLLQLLDTGRLMRFPDHGRFVQRLFEAVGVVNERQQLQKIFAESQENTRYLRQQIGNALEQLREQSRQRFDTVVGIFGILLSVSALADLFGLFGNAGYEIDGMTQLWTVFGTMGLIIFYFVVETIIRRLK